MTTSGVFFLLLLSPMVSSYTENAINLLVRPSINSTTRRYCVELAQLPDGHTINITSFAWHSLYIASPSVNACNITDLTESLPAFFPLRTILILSEHQCKMTEHAWNVQSSFGKDISLMVLTNRTNTHYELTYNKTAMPVSIPVLIFEQKDFNRMSTTFPKNSTTVRVTIDYPLNIPRKFRPAILLMFGLVLFLLLAGNFWAADEFIRKIRVRNPSTHSDQSSLNTTLITNDSPDLPSNNNESGSVLPKPNETTEAKNKTPRNNEPAVIYMPYCVIALILCFAVFWLLLIYYFPGVMIYILQVMFCIGAFSSLTSCLDRLSYFAPILRRHRIPSHTCRKPCTCQLGPLNVITLFAMICSLIVIIVWYIYRQADWAWILQDILGAAVCITVTSVYRLGNMRVITLILLGFFFYDIFFVFITPYIPLFNPASSKNPSISTTTTTTSMPPIGSVTTHSIGTYRKISRNPSVMEQVALGIGTNGEVVPLLFALPMFIPESEIDPCITIRKSMLGFGDVILPGILLTFCKIFDIASANRWPIYYTQSLVSYFIGLSLTHVALYLMNTAQPALLYLVPCVLLSTIITGLFRGELKELYTGRRIQLLLEDTPKTLESRLLADPENSTGDTANRSADMVVGITDAVAVAAGVENR